jgi:hypothetical protein
MRKLLFCLVCLGLLCPAVYAAGMPGSYLVSVQEKGANGVLTPMADKEVLFLAVYARGSDYRTAKKCTDRTDEKGNAQIDVPKSKWFPLPLPARFSYIDYLSVTLDEQSYSQGLAEVNQSRPMNPEDLTVPAKYSCETSTVQLPKAGQEGKINITCAEK